MLEDLLQNKSINEEDGGEYINLFHQIRKVLTKNLTSVVALEIALYSLKMKLAGRVDLIGYWKSTLSIIDFKNKNYPTEAYKIEEYWLQTCLYAMMFVELTGMLPEQLVVVASVEKFERPEAQVFTQKTRDWIPKVLEKVRVFHQTSDWYII